jgi:hypothetical protein
MVDDLVAKKGGIVAMGHTDSAFPIATETGGRIYVSPGGGPASRRVPVHALSLREVEEICAAFAPLNVFDRELMPGSPLKFKGLHEALILSGMHYCLIGPSAPAKAGGAVVTDGTRGIFGNYLSPTGDAVSLHLDAWQHVLDTWRGRPDADKPWLHHPAVSIYTLSRPAFAEKVSAADRGTAVRSIPVWARHRPQARREEPHRNRGCTLRNDARALGHAAVAVPRDK